MSKVISHLLWFCINTLCGWLTKFPPFFQPMGIQTMKKSCFSRTRFPAFGASYMYLFRILIGSLCCLHLLRLARVITLVLVLRHSIRNRSIRRLNYSMTTKRVLNPSLTCPSFLFRGANGFDFTDEVIPYSTLLAETNKSPSSFPTHLGKIEATLLAE